MIQATKALREEHHWIRLLLDCMEELVEKFRTNGKFDANAARELQALFEHFVDEQHQRKEEAALFPKLLERVQKLHDEHAEEREHLDRMRFSLFNAVLGDPSGRQEFIGEAEEYVALQRQHMAQENLGLLPLAEQILTDEDDKEVLEEFRRTEAKGFEHDEVLARVKRLCGLLEVPFEDGAMVE